MRNKKQYDILNKLSLERVNINNLIKFLVAMRFGDTPVLIPNTMVKTLAADDTMLETAWESRWLPDL